MAEMTEVRWHGRGGQGAVTAAKVLADCALSEGKYVQAFPEYGPERMGAPVKAYTRLSDGRITVHSQVENPSIVLVLDPTLLAVVDVTEGLTDDGIILVNSTDPPTTVAKQIGAGKRKVYTVDATGISIDELGRDIPNTAMLGALAKATGMLSLDGIIEDITHKFSGKFKQSIVDGNVRVIKRAYEEVKS